MKSPAHERRALLDEAVRVATEALDSPIDRIVVGAAHIRCWSGRRRVTMRYGYAQGGIVAPGSGRFQPTPGSGEWNVTLVDEPRSTSAWWRRWGASRPVDDP